MPIAVTIRRPFLIGMASERLSTSVRNRYRHQFGMFIAIARNPHAGNHNVRFGADFRMFRESGYGYGNASPQFTFASTYTNGPLANSPGAPIGQGLASFLLGVPIGGAVSVNASDATQSTYTGGL